MSWIHAITASIMAQLVNAHNIALPLAAQWATQQIHSLALLQTSLRLQNFPESTKTCLHCHLRSFSHHHLGCHLTPHTSILLLAGSEVTGRTVMPMARRTMGTGAREPGEACLATWVRPSVTFSTANKGQQD